MSFEDLLRWLGRHPGGLTLALALPPLLCLLLRGIHGRAGGSAAPWRYVYGVCIYWVSIPGIFMGTLLAYLCFFRNADLLKLNLLTHFLPVLSMGITLALIRGNVRTLDDIPGFDRLSGLLTLLALSFAAAFFLQRLHIGIVFLGDFGNLLVLASLCFAAIQWALRRLGGEKSRAPRDP
ncbi:MAG: hypothetical protein RLZZ244_139 [Verrucomicrobiota bacterium]|jgi:hypothetical protein